MTDLKPCPFCGGKANLEALVVGDDTYHSIMCPDCGAHIAEDDGERWNNRPGEDVLQAKLEILAEAMSSRHCPQGKGCKEGKEGGCKVCWLEWAEEEYQRRYRSEVKE